MAAARLPGAALIEQGLADLAAERETVESLLVSIDAPQLRSLGLDVGTPITDPELRLYRRLAAECGAAAHARYNALLRELVSYRRAAVTVRAASVAR